MKAKKRLPLLDKLFLWVNYAVAIALLISYLAPVTDPRKFWIIAFFGLAYPLLLVSNVLLIIYWALRKRWYFLVSTVSILCGLGILNSNIGLHTGNNPQKSTGNNIRVMTYNVHNFKKFGSNKDISTKHEILEMIGQQQPDIIGFQEFYSRKKGQYDMIDSIRHIVKLDNYYFEAFQFNQDEAIGMAIFSRFPIVNKGLIRLSDDTTSSNQCVYMDIKKNDKVFRIYSVHLQSIQFEPQDYKYMDTVAKAGPDVHSTMRLGTKLKRAFLKRAEQVLRLKTHAAQCQYPYIIAGDFNDTPTSFAVNRMGKGLKNAFCEKGWGLGRTYNGDFPNYQIDYIMVSPQFDVATYHIIEKKLSDHFPVVSDLVLR